MNNVLALPPAVPPPAATGGFALYLDFDGVLHPENVHMRPGKGPYIESPLGHKLFENVGLLEKVLLPYPDLRVVLSTSWVRVYRSVARVARKLPPELRARVVGATFHEDMDAELFKQAPRGMQIWADVLRRKPDNWLAVDDDYLHWPTWCRDKLVRTHEVLGISAPVVLAELRAKLAAMYQQER
ncbi:HAD domain-containing protein [Paraburkholderia fungorum]|uniref:HAD domain-containing protein n=1 Tax=Paraburkholderia fungorum TaxID=134537 RepID=UPI0038BB6980